MKLSEAIRLGAMLKPQAHGHLWEDGKSCAFGAACDALGIALCDGDWVMFALARRFPALDAAVQCPACGWWRRLRTRHEYDLEDVIIHLNDDHRWKRERIADWIEGLEAAQDSGVTPSSDAVATTHNQGTATVFA